MNENFNVRKTNPLVHCITNYVTVNDVANILLACGGSPIMADDKGEVSEIVSISNALVLNIGTLNERTIQAMIQAGKTANIKGIPVILDPVGAGASPLRNETIKKLLKEVKFAVIKGNISEISYLAGLNASARGVDCNFDDLKSDTCKIAKTVALIYKCIVAVTGAIDCISDGMRVSQITNGVALMSKITGTGCMLGAVIGAYIGANGDFYSATVAAIAAMGIAGELAYDRTYLLGTGSFHMALMDEMSKINDKTIEEKAKINEKKD